MAVMGVFWTPMALLQQTAGYVTTFVAQYFGAREHEKIGSAVWQAIYCSIGGGLLFLGFLFVSSDIFTMIGHSPAMRDAGTAVLRRNLLVGIADRTCRRL